MTDYNDDPDSSGSRIIIGGYDLQKYAQNSSSITWNYLLNKNYWAVTLTKVSVLGTSSFDLGTSSTVTIVDSGTSYMLMPTKDHAVLVNHLNN